RSSAADMRVRGNMFVNRHFCLRGPTGLQGVPRTHGAGRCEGPGDHGACVMHLGEESLPGRVDAFDVCQDHRDRNFGDEFPEWSPRAAQLFHRVALEASCELQNVGCARLGGELVCRDDPECGCWLRMHDLPHRLTSWPRRARRTPGRSALYGDPLANVGGTVLQSDACGFPAGEETDDVAVDES